MAFCQSLDDSINKGSRFNKSGIFLKDLETCSPPPPPTPPPTQLDAPVFSDKEIWDWAKTPPSPPCSKKRGGGGICKLFSLIKKEIPQGGGLPPLIREPQMLQKFPKTSKFYICRQGRGVVEVMLHPQINLFFLYV